MKSDTFSRHTPRSGETQKYGRSFGAVYPLLIPGYMSVKYQRALREVQDSGEISDESATNRFGGLTDLLGFFRVRLTYPTDGSIAVDGRGMDTDQNLHFDVYALDHPDDTESRLASTVVFSISHAFLYIVQPKWVNRKDDENSSQEFVEKDNLTNRVAAQYVQLWDLCSAFRGVNDPDDIDQLESFISLVESVLTKLRQLERGISKTPLDRELVRVTTSEGQRATDHFEKMQRTGDFIDKVRKAAEFFASLNIG